MRRGFFNNNKQAKMAPKKVNRNSPAKPSPENAAIKIQAHVRGFLARRRYAIKHLPQAKLEAYKANIVGNDPDMTSHLSQFNFRDKKIAVVGTSCLRSVLIACQLGSIQYLPKIIIIDNSREVCSLWRKIRELMRDERCSNRQYFLDAFSVLLNSHRELYVSGIAVMQPFFTHPYNNVRYHTNHPLEFMLWLCHTYDYQFIRKLIINTTIIGQSWADKEVPKKIKNHLHRIGIDNMIVYTSNIVSLLNTYSYDQEVKQILQNIEAMNPDLALYTSTTSIHGRNIPEKIYCIRNHNIQEVGKILLSDHAMNEDDEDCLENLLAMRMEMRHGNFGNRSK